MPTRILHISDLHVRKKRKKNGKETVKENANLSKVVRSIRSNGKWQKNKPIILITGDLVHDGTSDQFIDARDLLDPLYRDGFMVRIVPGNHDYGRLGNHAIESRFECFKAIFYPGQHVSYPHGIDPPWPGGHLFIGLNSMKAECDYVDGLGADGELGAKQINLTVKLIDQFRKTAGRSRKKHKVIVYLHHHPFLYPDDSALEDIGEYLVHYLKDGDDFMRLMAGRVDILAFGHEHRHLNFSGTAISRKYAIPHILSCGKTTVDRKQRPILDSGHANKDKDAAPVAQGLLGYLIEISNNGTVAANTMEF